ncbi:YesL family protein [Ammoniphilus sp. YIM 78166]|uniref:YesL family protein n=1 Tax=Ammoniphilus sp. YIM 78166 TaxID=1644106 RepID=UPI00106F6736|nr:DUF624 domain-containing protein [Ammoniphilus sp. YIM 78166]
MNSWIEGTNRICDWVAKLAWLNILWLLFSLLGLGLFGLMPSTIAMFAVIRKWLQEEEVSDGKEFWRIYKKEFWRANLLGGGLALIGYLLYLNAQIFSTMDGMAFEVMSYILVGFLGYQCLMLIYFFPLYANYEFTFSQYLVYASSMIIYHPIRTAFSLAGCILLFFLYLSYPALLIFFSGSSIAFLLMWNAYGMILRFEQINMRG